MLTALIYQLKLIQSNYKLFHFFKKSLFLLLNVQKAKRDFT